MPGCASCKQTRAGPFRRRPGRITLSSGSAARQLAETVSKPRTSWANSRRNKSRRLFTPLTMTLRTEAGKRVLKAGNNGTTALLPGLISPPGVRCSRAACLKGLEKRLWVTIRQSRAPGNGKSGRRLEFVSIDADKFPARNCATQTGKQCRRWDSSPRTTAPRPKALVTSERTGHYPSAYRFFAARESGGTRSDWCRVPSGGCHRSSR